MIEEVENMLCLVILGGQWSWMSCLNRKAHKDVHVLPCPSISSFQFNRAQTVICEWNSKLDPAQWQSCPDLVFYMDFSQFYILKGY